MTNSNERLNRIEQIQESNARAIAALTQITVANSKAIAANSKAIATNLETIAANSEAIANLTENINNLTQDVSRTLARSAILGDIILDMQHNRQREETSREAIMQKLDQILEKLDEQ